VSKVIAEGILAGSDIGEVSLLKKYEKGRKLANLTMIAIMEGFQKAFSVDIVSVNILQTIAFHSAQHFGPLKRSINLQMVRGNCPYSFDCIVTDVAAR
jgi:ubiquinone biosynthesis monooxygenase Coq6